MTVPHRALDTARITIRLLPAPKIGTCVLTRTGELFRGSTGEIQDAVGSGDILFHHGRIKGAYPQPVTP